MLKKGNLIEKKNPKDDIKMIDYWKMFFDVIGFYKGTTKYFFKNLLI